MAINWKVRFKNKVFLASMLALIVSFVYDALALLGVAPGVDESTVMALVDTVLKELAALGILVDPTTAGVGDSIQALGYIEPKK